MRKNNNWILIILVVLLVVFGIYMIWGRGETKRDSYTPEDSKPREYIKTPSENDVELIDSDNTAEDIEIIPSDMETNEIELY